MCKSGMAKVVSQRVPYDGFLAHTHRSMLGSKSATSPWEAIAADTVVEGILAEQRAVELHT